MPESWILQLGLAAPLVLALIALLKRQTDEATAASNERREITAQFLKALTTTVQESNEARLRVALEVKALQDFLDELSKAQREEHKGIVDALARFGTQLLDYERRSTPRA